MISKDQWNKLVIEKDGEFLQGWEWGVFQEALGRKVIRIYNANLGPVQIIVTKLPLGQSYAYVPRGPVGAADSGGLVDSIISSVQDDNIFLLLEPPRPLAHTLFRPAAARSRQPLKTLLVDLVRTEPELLSSFSSKTRYNIGLARRKNLEFKKLDEVGAFWHLLKKTARHQNFKIYPRSYFECLHRLWGGNDSPVEILGVTFQGKLLAAGLFYKFGRTVTYLHGASDYHYRALMAPYLLHGQAINYFKQKGLEWYDFWGIDEWRWPGLTRFKKGFGGQVKAYPGTGTIVFKPAWYKLYNLAKKWI